MTEHTKTPWDITTYPTDTEGGILIRGANGNGQVICDVKSHPDNGNRIHANAAHIVKCVNLHDELVNALAEVNSLFNAHYSIGNDDEAGNAIHDKVRTILAKVKGA